MAVAKWGANNAVLIVHSSQMFTYWAHAALMATIDLNGWFENRKVQPSYHPDAATYRSVLLNVLHNQIVVGGAVQLLFTYVGMPWRGVDPAAPFPAWTEVLRDLVVFVACEEVGFFYGHRLLHWGPLYRRVHKLHHTFTAPFGWVAIYCHPFEMILSNLIPFYAGPFLMGSHPLTAALWFNFGIINTINAHCGYWLPGMPNPAQHDWHHERTTECFGLLGVLDTWHGTNTRFVKHAEELAARRAEAKAA